MKGAKGFANTGTGKPLIHTFDQKLVDRINTNRLKRVVKNNPVVGSYQKDELALDRVRKIFHTEFVNLLFRDYLHCSGGPSTLLLAASKGGTGKSVFTNIVARGKHEQGPKSFFILKVDGCKTGSDWLAEIKAQLGVEPDTTPENLVMYVVTALVESTTSDKFRVNTAGQNRKIIVNKTLKGKPLLIIDGLDPDCLGSRG